MITNKEIAETVYKALQEHYYGVYLNHMQPIAADLQKVDYTKDVVMRIGNIHITVSTKG